MYYGTISKKENGCISFRADNEEAHSERSPVREEELGHRQVLVPTMLSAAEWSGHRKSKCSITL